VIEVKGLVKTFIDGTGAEVKAIDHVSFKVEEGRFYTLLGPSGCGKTTTLRCIAGLEKPNEGEITVSDTTVYSSSSGAFVPPYKREIGMVFQSYAIWPHLTVLENVAFPIRVSNEKVSNDEIRKRVHEALEQVEMGGLEDRMATQLSGGQQQRLALARALVRRPKVLLLDEPLSNLDAKLRERMRMELRELQRRHRITTLYVTHDQLEALSMSNTIAVMSAGKIVQYGAPREIYDQPNTKFVAQFIGSTNQISGDLTVQGEEGKGKVRTPIGELSCSVLNGLDTGAEVVVVVRPESIVLHREKPADAVNVIEGKIAAAMFLGEYVDCSVEIGKVILQTHQSHTLRVRRGEAIWVELPPGECLALPGER
jgi:iron(III) transport system ATP-binding protein